MSTGHLALTLVVCFAWGFNFIAAAVGLQHFPPLTFTILRFMIVLAVLAPWLRLPPRAQWARLVAVCLSNGALHFTFNFWGLRLSADVSSVAILIQCYVPIAALLAMFLLGERIGWRRGAAIAVAFAGVLVVGLEPGVTVQLDSVALVLVSAFWLALGTILMRGLSGLNAFAFQAWTALISIPVLIPLSMVLEADHARIVATAAWSHWGGIVYSALGASIVGHGLLFYLIQRHPVSAVTPYLLLTPIIAVGLGVAFWGDRPGWRLIVGGALVLGGVLVITLRARAAPADFMAARRAPVPRQSSRPRRS